MKTVIILGTLLLVCVSPACAERLACQDEHERARNLSMDVNFMDNPDWVSESVQAKSDSYDCLANYESKHGKEAREDLSAKLNALKLDTE